ncbi:unnamed protein product [Didymodactylos carnosus]|uniref:G-protein coupled receptors family 1 profile domain-containing protein n=1 Tax=Didymodactylos carnosus TaxID=1234261 RepID=A0A815W1E0_9BILA|nr:unnamed protein product [Didymodactylos carnosus]CAF1535090.1 unnamed protein product [Didymodactylos carnosus]CAF4024067.1 unnamed protein product [Didymodactylos carnosus]CAF4394785.1 unnamed protein product [Didymodactylos carnosus]
MSTAAATINTVTRWLTYLLAIPMITLGIIGAILTIIVFTRQQSFRRNTTITYLLAGAIMTAIHLPFIYLQNILVDGFHLGVFNTNDIACRERNYLFYVTTVAAVSYPCWAAFDQYAGTCREAAFRHRWSSMRVVRLAIVSTVIFWAIVYFPMIFVSSSVNGVCILIDGPFAIFYNYVLAPIVFIVGPITLITVFTWGTLRNLHTTTLVKHNHRLAKQVRRMLIPQLFILALFGIPFGIDNMYQNITRKVQKDAIRLAIEHLFDQITRLFYHIIFVSTFYIYLYMSSVVRKVLRRLITKHFKNNVIIPTNISSDRPITLQTLKSINFSQ